MIGFVLRAAIFAVLGLVAGIGYYRGIQEGARIHQETGERGRPMVMFLFRFLLVVAFFGILWKAGPLAWLSAFGGFFAARLFTGKAPRRKA